MTTRTQLRNRIRRNLGHPFVKIELCDEHLDDAINSARDMWIKWAVGNATQERWLLVLLKANWWLYDLPAGVTEVMNYRDELGYGGTSGSGSHHTYESGGAQTLFSMDNAMYMAGYNNLNYGSQQGGYNMVSWVIANQAMGDMEHYHVNRYNWYYHRQANQLEIQPNVMPDIAHPLSVTTDLSGNYTSMENPIPTATSANTSASEVDSPGWVLLRVMMLEGSALPNYQPPLSGDATLSIYNIADNYSELLFSETWIMEYSTALAMITLGRIRRKFAGYSSIGGQGISLDGSDLIQEGTTEKDRLELELDTKHAYEGFDIILG